METLDLKASLREVTKKGNCRRLRADGFIPAVLYGAKKDNVLLSVSNRELSKLLEGRFEAPFIQLLIDSGKSPDKRLSIIKEIQRNPASRRFWHIDFLELDTKVEATFEVAVHLVGRPVGLDKGGEMFPVKNNVLVSCLPYDLMASIDVDVSRLDIGDTLKVGDIAFGKKIKVLDQLDALVVSVHAQREEVAKAVPEEVGAAKKEPVVIKQKAERKEK